MYKRQVQKLSQQAEHLDISDFTFNELAQFKAKKLEKGILTYRSLKGIGLIDGEVVPSVSEMKALVASKVGAAAVELLQFDAINAIVYMQNTPSKTRHNFSFPTIEHKGLKVSLMEPGDPKQLIMGHLTSCCQSIDWAGSDCVENSWTKENFGTVKIEKDGRIVAQSYVWTTPKAFIFDNVEMNKQYYGDISINTSIKESIELATRQLEKTYNHVIMGLDYNKIQAFTKSSEYRLVRENVLSLGVSKLQLDSYSDALDDSNSSGWGAIRLDKNKNIEHAKLKPIEGINKINVATIIDLFKPLGYDSIPWTKPLILSTEIIRLAVSNNLVIQDKYIVNVLNNFGFGKHMSQDTLMAIANNIRLNYPNEADALIPHIHRILG